MDNAADEAAARKNIAIMCDLYMMLPPLIIISVFDTCSPACLSILNTRPTDNENGQLYASPGPGYYISVE
jgi:hypothetical protein